MGPRGGSPRRSGPSAVVSLPTIEVPPLPAPVPTPAPGCPPRRGGDEGHARWWARSGRGRRRQGAPPSGGGPAGWWDGAARGWRRVARGAPTARPVVRCRGGGSDQALRSSRGVGGARRGRVSDVLGRGGGTSVGLGCGRRAGGARALEPRSVGVSGPLGRVLDPARHPGWPSGCPAGSPGRWAGLRRRSGGCRRHPPRGRCRRAGSRVGCDPGARSGWE